MYRAFLEYTTDDGIVNADGVHQSGANAKWALYKILH